jgi:arylformamidase
VSRWIDVTAPLTGETPTWPGDPLLQVERVADLARGDEATVSRVAFSAHLGTHVDAPLHYLAGGADVAALPIDVLCGPCRVVSVPGSTAIDRAALEALQVPRHVPRLLLATVARRRHTTGFDTAFRGLTVDAAAWLVDRGIVLVGTDAPSIGPYENGADTHRVLLGAGVVVVENVDLRGVAPGPYDLWCLPLPLVGLEASPARVILSRQGDARDDRAGSA